MLLYILVGLAFCLGAGVVLGSFFGVTQLPGILLQRKLEARLEEVAMGPDVEPPVPGSGRGEGRGEGCPGRPDAGVRSVRRRDDARVRPRTLD